MSIEEQFRDTKGARFGLKIKWTCFTRGEYLERMYLLIGVAGLLGTNLGRFTEREKPNVRMKCRKTKESGFLWLESAFSFGAKLLKH